MRYKTGHKEEARGRMIAAAGRGFRRKGFGGIGVDGLAKEAEVTSGAFYGHFASKEAAFEAAVATGLDDLAAGVRALQAEHGARWLERFVDFYLNERRTCDVGDACALQALSPDVARGSASAKAVFMEHMDGVLRAVADGLEGRTSQDRLDKAWSLLSLLSGGVTLARAVSDPAQSKAIAVGIRKGALALAAGRAVATPGSI
ncbi:TetR/AcrR family transcriptional regulator [Bradyrhizobium sp. STM 3809]|uniref:TetR/AcrR family transcriptional regulator n=1 Tax=Bradyrhizobium sp. STM 3809 TaxID=551936 RepID=UPI00024097C6|nr:TetR/AcrR family transcriptional regulator [Bradyrhizobium sp. STM 3809]CCE01238.1 Transcriptional regulator, TetR family [Bradyrhizobium sp. STM 3809]